ncbi:MAG: threonylcarbamoyl-AMP synthase [Erysipelotrichia bacterium]|nr:threonylcarbamoyl-AMP synthase [Erysipelotrichia bacterium]
MNKIRRYRESEIEQLAEILRNDGTVSVPTDTVYGVCARMDSLTAQENLRELKHRPETKAFPIMCSDLEQIQSVAETDARSEKLIQALMPGPVTLILKKKEGIPDYVNGGMATLAIRMATSEAVRKLISAVGCPLFMTSANQSGEPVCTSLDEIERSCQGLGGMLEGTVTFGKASTIIDCSQAEIKILRPGPIGMEEIESAIQK